VVAAQGLTTEQIALKIGRTKNGVRQTLDKMRRNNKVYKTASLVAIATELDLINPLAIEGIKICARSQQNSSPINVTDDFKQIGVELKV